jgi:alkylhydroperoxidase/carboxymuconolactone decarboxylase family protein YurZ
MTGGIVMKEENTAGRVAAFMRFEYLPNSLDAKTRELVLLSASAVAGCDH